MITILSGWETDAQGFSVPIVLGVINALWADNPEWEYPYVDLLFAGESVENVIPDPNAGAFTLESARAEILAAIEADGRFWVVED